MANAALLLANIFDAATLAASSEADGMPVSLLQTPGVTDDLWRSTSGTAAVTADLGADTAFDTVALLAPFGAAETVRLRVSTEAGGPTSGDVLDTGVLDSSARWYDPDYGMFLYLAAAALTARYVRFDLAAASASWVEAGRLVGGTREAFDYNFAPGGQFDWTDPSPVRKTKGGGTLVWERPMFRTAAISLPWVSNSQRWGLVERLGRVNGRHADVLLMLDPDADNLPQWSIWGLVTDQSPAAWTDLVDVYSKQIRIEERR